jgi:hypothetical protein
MIFIPGDLEGIETSTNESELQNILSDCAEEYNFRVMHLDSLSAFKFINGKAYKVLGKEAEAIILEQEKSEMRKIADIYERCYARIKFLHRSAGAKKAAITKRIRALQAMGEDLE